MTARTARRWLCAAAMAVVLIAGCSRGYSSSGGQSPWTTASSTTSTTEPSDEWSATWTSGNGFVYRFSFDPSSLGSEPANPGYVNPTVGRIRIENTHTDRVAPLGSDTTSTPGGFLLAVMFKPDGECTNGETEALFAGVAWCWFTFKLADVPVELDPGESVSLKHFTPNQTFTDEQWQAALDKPEELRFAVVSSQLQFGGISYNFSDEDTAMKSALCPTEHRPTSGWLIVLTDAGGKPLNPSGRGFTQRLVDCDYSIARGTQNEPDGSLAMRVMENPRADRGVTARILEPNKREILAGVTVRFINTTDRACNLAIGERSQPWLMLAPGGEASHTFIERDSTFHLYCEADNGADQLTPPMAGGTVVVL